MRRRYVMYVELTVVLSDPEPADEGAVRGLGNRLAEYVTKEIDDFPWPVDVTLSQAVDRVES
jgi:hypothetical protein